VMVSVALAGLAAFALMSGSEPAPT